MLEIKSLLDYLKYKQFSGNIITADKLQPVEAVKLLSISS